MEVRWRASHRFGRKVDGNDRKDGASITRRESSRFLRPPKTVDLPPHSKCFARKRSLEGSIAQDLIVQSAVDDMKPISYSTQ